MKRHPSLAHLSRDHHGALVLARLLQKNAPAYTGLPSDIPGKAAYAIKFYREKLVKHFEAEEKVLILVTGLNETLDLLTQTIFREHIELHALFQSISDEKDLTDHLDALGKALEIHIRKEERELFPLIKETCSDDLMTVIEASLLSGKKFK